MKQVLLVDASDLFKNFLSDKFSGEKIQLETALGDRDAFAKVITILPDLIIMDIKEEAPYLDEFLRKVHNDPNAKHIPIIICGPSIELDKVSILAQFGVVKYFTKPVKFDIFMESVGKILGVRLSIDLTPCVMELHVNNNIIFIEISQGLNREKISLLKYKIPLLIERNKIDHPKIILMMTDLTLSFVDGTNLELLLNTILEDNRIRRRNVKILSLDSFTKALVEGHDEYDGIEVAESLNNVINSIVDDYTLFDTLELVSDRILSSTGTDTDDDIGVRFEKEPNDSKKTQKALLNVAVVDEDPTVRSELNAAFKSINAECHVFGSGKEFVSSLSSNKYSLIILDIYIHDMNGFDILSNIRSRNLSTPVIIYSQPSSKDIVVQALSLGATKFYVKPLKNSVILQIALDIVNKYGER